jgi:fatty-acyl-CoA synthase
MKDQGLGSWPRRRARSSPDRVAVVADGVATTYRELDRQVQQLANLFRENCGVSRGDRVAYLGPNGVAFLQALFATSALGAVFVPLNTRLTAHEYTHILSDCGASLLLVDPAFQSAIDAAHSVGTPVRLLDGHFDALIAATPASAIDETVGASDTCIVMYTSGTTGAPKGATLTHDNVIWNAINVLVDLDLRSDEVTLVTAPMFHVAALNMTCLPTLLKGGCVVLEPNFNPDRVLDLIERDAITLLFGVPTMYSAIAASPRWANANLSSLRILLCGGAPVPNALTNAYLDRGLSFIQGYGMTEATAGVLCLDKTMSQRKTGSAGVPHFFTDVRIVGPELEDVGVGEPGEVLVSGPNVSPGYWDLPEATRDTFVEGWLRTGDIAIADEDGFVFIVDRVKDMFISGGENVYPAEVEKMLYHHPSVQDCAVIGVPDPKWGEVGKAIVVLKPDAVADANAILQFAADRLGKYKVPKSVMFVNSLPRNASGKILKSKLRTSPPSPTPPSGPGVTADNQGHHR